MDGSILKYISDAVTADGILPADFSLPKPADGKKAMFADEILELLKTANNGDFDKAAEGFSKFCEKFPAIVMIDEVQNAILDNRDGMSVNVMVRFAKGLIRDSDDRELIKVGLIILELVNTSNDPDLMKDIRTLGLSDEFTIFTVFIMRHWPDGQMEILDLAKKVRGWGRIHCVKFIEPENDEIAHWLLVNGIDNDILREYSALTVYEKTGIWELLDRTDLSDEEVRGILRVIGSMFPEGPVQGISAVEDPPGLLRKVLALADRIVPDEEEKKVIEAVSDLKKRFDETGIG